MNNVTMKRHELLDAMRKNRKEHRDTFLKAQERYREEAIKELDRMLADARSGRCFAQRVSLEAPVDHTDDYDTAIGMLEAHVEPTIEIDSRSFKQYVEDRWPWTDHFIRNSGSYGVPYKKRS